MIPGIPAAVLLVVLAGPPAKADPMFPDGTEYDFGVVPFGQRVRHKIRVVNTSKVPVRIVSLRRH
jgi:hypothetical protein